MGRLYKLVLIGLIHVCAVGMYGQDNYVLLSGASGVERSEYEPDVEFKASQLIESLNGIDNAVGTNISSNFKVFDVDLYLHNSTMDGGISAAIGKAIEEADLLADHYLMFVKISNNEGIYQEIRTKVKMPLLNSDCASQSNMITIEEMLNASIVNIYSNQYENINNVIISSIETFSELVDYVYVCCVSSELAGNSKKSNSDCIYSSFDEMKFVLYHNQLSEIESINILFEAIQSFIDRMEMCVEENWLTYPELFQSFNCAGDTGIIPICLIEADQISDQMIANVRRFRPGIVDGIYAAIAELPQSLKDLSKLFSNVQDVKDAFTWALIRCNSKFYKVNLEACDDYYNGLSNLDINNTANSSIASLLDRLKNEAGYYEKLDAYISDCDQAQEIRTTIIDFVTDLEKIRQILNTLTSSIDDYFQTFEGPAAFYCSGRIVGDILLGIIGDKGATKVSKIIEKLEDVQNVLRPLFNKTNRIDYYDDIKSLADHPDFEKLSTEMFEDFLGDKDRLQQFMNNKTERDLYIKFKDTVPCN